MHCPICQQEIPNSSMFCPKCGVELHQEKNNQIPQSSMDCKNVIQDDEDSFYNLEREHSQKRKNKNKESKAVPKHHFNSSKSVSRFVSSFQKRSGFSNDPYEYNIPIVPECVQPIENEVVVKQYNIAKLRSRLKFMKADGRLMVTNRRILFRAAGTSLTGKVLQEHEFDIDELAGIEIHQDYKFSFLNLFGGLLFEVFLYYLFFALFFHMAYRGPALGIILSLGAVVCSIILHQYPWLRFFCSGISAMCCYLLVYLPMGISYVWLMIPVTLFFLANLFVNCFVKNLVIKLKLRGGYSAIHIGSKKSLLQRHGGTDEYSGFTEVLPWEDTTMAMNELGALLDDLRKRGDYAIEKWSK